MTTMFSDSLFFTHVLQRDPAEEALKSNNMNLDQAMSTSASYFVDTCPCVGIENR